MNSNIWMFWKDFEKTPTEGFIRGQLANQSASSYLSDCFRGKKAHHSFNNRNNQTINVWKKKRPKWLWKWPREVDVLRVLNTIHIQTIVTGREPMTWSCSCTQPEKRGKTLKKGERERNNKRNERNNTPKPAASE